MKSTFLFLLAFIALGRAQENDNCTGKNLSDRTYYCVKNALASVFANSKEETCMELRKSANCLETIAEECIEDEYRGYIDIELKKMNDMIENVCSYEALGKLENSECRPRRLEERMNNCFAGTQRLLRMNDPTEDHICSELKNTEKCLRAVADDCLTERQKALVEEQFRRLHTRLRPICPNTDSPDDDDDACMEVHKDYIYGCLRENQMKAITHFFGISPINRNVMTCTLYNWISECVIERVGTKCGVIARNKMRNDLNEPSSEIKDACNAENMNYRN